jgi:hypothetical protein
MSHPIKIIFDVEENEYVVFVESIGIEGRGGTEKEAVDDLITKYGMKVERI